MAILNHAFFEIYLFNLYTKIGEGKLTDEERIICTNNHNNNLTSIHPCLANAALSFRRLPKDLEQLFGSKNLKDYEWGKIHKHTFKSIPFGDIPGLNKIWGRQV